MAKMILITIVMLIMMLAPLFLSWIYFLKSDGVILQISQDKSRDQRYFAHSFSDMIESALHSVKGNTIKLSHEEKFLDMEDIRQAYRPEVDKLTLVLNEDFESASDLRFFHKEIYAAKNAAFYTPNLTIRAAYSRHNMYLGNKIRVIRWVDGEETLAVYDDCDLGMSATAGRILSIGKNVTFRRLYAPIIHFGQYPGAFTDPMKGRDPLVFKLPVYSDKKNIKHVTHEHLTEYGTATYSVVTGSKTMIVEDAILQGDIHADRNVRICSGAGVLGNIFAENNILLEKGSFVVGNVFAQGNIEIEDDVMVGLEGRSVSVICRNKLFIGENVTIYGYVSSETKGFCCPIYDADEPRYSDTYRFIKYNAEPLDVSFKDLKEYEDTDDMAYRMNPNVVSVAFPEGAASIRRSMFCGCGSLKQIFMAKSIAKIDDYAFYDCHCLLDPVDLGKTALESVGVSAFENCKNVTALHLPHTLKRIGAAAFAGMEALTELSIEVVGEELLLEDHSFRGCKGLEKVFLPDRVRSVGVSSFRDCSSLKELSVSKELKNEPGIAELPELLPDTSVVYR